MSARTGWALLVALWSAGVANADLLPMTCITHFGPNLGTNGAGCNLENFNNLTGVSDLVCVTPRESLGGGYVDSFLGTGNAHNCSSAAVGLSKLLNKSDGFFGCSNDDGSAFWWLTVPGSDDNCYAVAKTLTTLLQGPTCKHGNPLPGPSGGGQCYGPCDQGWKGRNCDVPGLEYFECNSRTHQCLQVEKGGGGSISSCLQTCTPPPTPSPTPVPPCNTTSCGFHQYCDSRTQNCRCEHGWFGPTCSCGDYCNGRGTCPGVCECDKGYGGFNCSTFLDGSPLFPETQIVTAEWGAQLNDWAKQPAGQKWALCYSSYTMNKTAETFHHGCDQYDKTVSVAHNLLGSTFGGYADATWLLSRNNAYKFPCRSDPKDRFSCYKGTSACFIFELGPKPLKLGPAGHDLGGIDPYMNVQPHFWPVFGYTRGFGIDGVLETDLSFGYDERAGQPGGGGIHGWPGANGICGGGTTGTYVGKPHPPGQPRPPPICGSRTMGSWGSWKYGGTNLEVWRQV